ncbi:MAG: pilus assembly protein [Anaerolineae bacterium]|jgi:pilus assembly protein Flp/PilA|nr:pilus assembly protein [Anaerolineae bacterium]
MLFLGREAQRGQGLIEYALVLVLVAVVVIVVISLLGPQIGNMYSRITHGW